MSTPFVVHHVDYRSKAKERQAELDDLRKRSLAKPKAARLQDAEAPTEMYHSFLEKQRQMFVDQRKSQAAAIEFLHQYRADDEMVLRKASQRHPNNACSRPSLSPSQTPDARAAVYTSYPTMLSYPTTPLSPPRRDSKKNTPDATNVFTDLSTTSWDVESDPVAFERVLEALQRRAEEAALIPLPNDDDEEGPILILEAVSPRGRDVEHEARDVPSHGSVSTDCSIPFESFLKLGESQIMVQHAPPPRLGRRNDPASSWQSKLDCDETPDDGSDNDSIIPGVAFMNLGASMLAEAIDSPKGSYGDDGDDDTEALTDPGRSLMDDSCVGVEQRQQSTSAATCLASSTEGSVVSVETNQGLHDAVPSTLARDVASSREARAMATNVGLESVGVVPVVPEIPFTGALSEGMDDCARGFGVVLESKAGVVFQPETHHRQQVMEISTSSTKMAKGVDGTSEHSVNDGADDAVTSEPLACVNVTYLDALVENSQETERNAKKGSDFSGAPDCIDEVCDEIAPISNANSSSRLPTGESMSGLTGATLAHLNGDIQLENVEAGNDAVLSAHQSTGQRRIGRMGTTGSQRQPPKPKRKKETGYYPSSSLFVSRQYFSR